MERIVPLHQAKIHAMFEASVVVADREYRDAVCALSEHVLVITKKSCIFGLSRIIGIHILDIEKVVMPSDRRCEISTRSDRIVVIADECVQFTRLLVRNYFVVTMMFPPNMRFSFVPHNPDLFPQFSPRMSLSQMFQFSYNANCSYYSTSYEHEVAQFFHRMVLSRSGIVDLTKIPLAMLEVGLGDPVQLRPLFTSLMFCPVVYGVVCYGVARPDVMQAIAPLVLVNANVSIVDLHGCGIETGMVELSDAIMNNRNGNVTYWDLSDNPFHDVMPFCSALGRTQARVFHVNLANTGMTTAATTLLFHALRTNPCLWNMRYMDLRGAMIREDGIKLFRAHLLSRRRNGGSLLRSLNIGGVRCNYGHMLDVLLECQAPLRHLGLAKASLNRKTFQTLLDYVASARLLSLDVGESNLNSKEVAELITVITGNPKIKRMELGLAGLNLNKKRLRDVVTAFKGNGLTKWTGIDLSCNNLNASEINGLVVVFREMRHLSKLSIGGNICEKDTDGIRAIMLVAGISTLKSLNIRGTRWRYMGSGILAFIDALMANTTLDELDISMNMIGDTGIEKVCDLLEYTSALTEIKLDGSFPWNYHGFSRLLNLLASPKTSARSCEFPMDDCYHLIQSMKSETKRRNIFAMLATTRNHIQLREKDSSYLTKKNIAELNSLLQYVSRAIEERLECVPNDYHAALASTFGLPMPHRAESEDQLAGAVALGDPDVNNVYRLENSNVYVL